MKEENNKKENLIKIFKIAFIGGTTVGKTTIAYRCLDRKLNPDEVDTTLEDHYKIYPEINDEKVEIEIIDTAGQDDYQNFFDTWVQYSDGFLLIFAINDSSTFDIIKNRYNKIIAMKGNEIPIILIGNKKDLENERKVLFKDAKFFANEHKIQYFETSALNDESNECKNILIEISKKIYNKKFKTKNIEQNKCCCSII
jgi:small GTP-binding protein